MITSHTIETVYRTPDRDTAEITARRIRAAFPEVADAVIITADGEYDPEPMFFVEMRSHGRTVADYLHMWATLPALDDLTTAYYRACVAYEVGVIDAPAFLAWMRENELA